MPTDRSTERKIVDAYASSMLQAAGDSQERILGIESQLRSLQHAYYLNDALASAFCSSNKHEDDKRKMAQELFKSFDSELQPILITLAVRGDIQYIERIVNAYIDKAENKLGCVIVDVVTAVELDDHLREVIGKKLEGDFGKPAIIRESVDKKIIGGIIMSAHGRRIDASIATKLEQTRVALANSPVGGES